MDAQLPGALREALCRERRFQVAAVVLCRARGGQLVALPQGWRDLASRRPRARSGFFRLLFVDHRVDPVGWCTPGVPARVGVTLVAGVLVRRSFPSLVTGSRAFPSFLLGLLVGARGGPQPARVACIVAGRHVVACRGGGGGRDGSGGARGRRVKERRRPMYCCGVSTASSDRICMLARSEAKMGETDSSCSAGGRVAQYRVAQNAHAHRTKPGSIYPMHSVGGSTEKGRLTRRRSSHPKRQFNLGAV